MKSHIIKFLILTELLVVYKYVCYIPYVCKSSLDYVLVP